jgi:hypothetical protein
MTPGAIIALVKDVVIVAALGFVIYMLINYGKDQVKVSDMKAVETQLKTNAVTEAEWRKEQVDANTKHDTNLATVASTIANQRAPVFLRSGPPSQCPVPNNPTKTSDQGTTTGSTDNRPGKDLRPDINAFELKYESAFLDCQTVLDQWPK